MKKSDVTEIVNYEKISKILLKNNKPIAARIASVKDDCLIVVFRDGTKGVIDLEDIAFITTMTNQPELVI